MTNADLTRKAERAVARAALELRTAAAGHALALSGNERAAAALLNGLRPSTPAKDAEILMQRYPRFARVAELLLLAEGCR
jgi:hypothetical protein